jgi:phage shock protein PspC (stress-responsive transcriptional regulator)
MAKWDSAASSHHRGGHVASTLTRPTDRAVIAGVCAGLADRFGMKPNTMRLIFVLSCLLPGPQFVIYIALWVIMPKRP